MRRIYLVSTILIFAFGALLSQETIEIKPLAKPEINGTAAPGEWDGANRIQIKTEGENLVNVYFMISGESLYFYFKGPMGSHPTAVPIFPEIVIDANNSKTKSWEETDYWFHVSASDCFWAGGFGVYNDCAEVQESWKAAPNFSGELLPDEVEIEIPLAKIGLSANNLEQIGLAFILNNTNGYVKMWPENASMDNPSSWGAANISVISSVMPGKAKSDDFLIYPNPTTGPVSLDLGGGLSGNYDKVKIRNLIGKEVLSYDLPKDAKGAINFNFSSIPAGIYLFEISGESGSVTKKLVIR